jgi:flagellar biosynthetic protein FliP
MLIAPAAALLVAGLAAWQPALAQNALPAFSSTPAPGGGQNYSLSLQTLLLLTSLTFLPAMLLMMTGFTRIIIVLSLLRQALGTPTAPPNQVLIGLSLKRAACRCATSCSNRRARATSPCSRACPDRPWKIHAKCR